MNECICTSKKHGQLLKFLYANQGVGRFTRLGIPFPHFTATFVGGLEIVGGLLVLAGLTTRLIAIPFIAEMIVAILSTKISLYLGMSPLPLPPAPPQVGFWYEIRSEYAQMLTVMFLLIKGPACGRLTQFSIAGAKLSLRNSSPRTGPWISSQ